MNQHRRDFLKQSSAGSVALLVGTSIFSGKASAASQAPAISTVSYLRGTNRKQMIYDVLLPIENEIKSAIVGKQIIIKPNFVIKGSAISVTHVDAVRGLLDFLKRITDTKKIIIAESSAQPPTASCLTEYGYNALTTEYGVTLLDMTNEPYTTVNGFVDNNGKPTTSRIWNRWLDDKNYFISICRPKTHSLAVGTFTMKNHLMAAPVKNTSSDSKTPIHGNSSQNISKNLCNIAKNTMPKLGIIDGLEGQEGEGPIYGTMIKHNMALAGTDPIAVDYIATKLIGIDPQYMMYLRYCADEGLGNFSENKISIVGPDTNYSSSILKYKMVANFNSLTSWMPKVNIAAKNATAGTLPLEVKCSNNIGAGMAVSFSLPLATDVSLDILNVKGQSIRKLASRNFSAGKYNISWDGKNNGGKEVAIGNYIARLQTEKGAAVTTSSFFLRK